MQQLDTTNQIGLCDRGVGSVNCWFNNVKKNPPLPAWIHQDSSPDWFGCCASVLLSAFAASSGFGSSWEDDRCALSSREREGRSLSCRSSRRTDTGGWNQPSGSRCAASLCSAPWRRSGTGRTARWSCRPPGRRRRPTTRWPPAPACSCSPGSAGPGWGPAPGWPAQSLDSPFSELATIGPGWLIYLLHFSWFVSSAKSWVLSQRIKDKVRLSFNAMFEATAEWRVRKQAGCEEDLVSGVQHTPQQGGPVCLPLPPPRWSSPEKLCRPMGGEAQLPGLRGGDTKYLHFLLQCIPSLWWMACRRLEEIGMDLRWDQKPLHSTFLPLRFTFLMSNVNTQRNQIKTDNHSGSSTFQYVWMKHTGPVLWKQKKMI